MAVFVPISRTVFEVGAEGLQEIIGRDFVVLFVGSGGFGGERGGGKALDPGLGRAGLDLELAEFAAQALTNTEADEAVGQEAFFSELNAGVWHGE